MPRLTDADLAKLDDRVFQERYHAINRHDQRYDGRFVTEARPDRTYHRPSCPGPASAPSDITFHTTTASAQANGLRACPHCHPDQACADPAWNHSDELPARAMRLILDGCVEREGVAGLASRLGYTPRHVTRVLHERLGAGPLALARAQRVRVAELLLTQTVLPIAQVARAAGFASARQFNDTVARVHATTPRRLRHDAWARNGRPPGDAERLMLRLPVRSPFDGAGVLEFLGVRAVEGVESFDGTTFTRTLRTPGGSAFVALRVPASARDEVECTLRLTAVGDLATVVTRVRRLLDLDADPVAVDTALAQDPALADRVRAIPGIRLPGAVDVGETVVRAMIGQQISVPAARTALSRLAAALGERTELGLLFPTPAAIAQHGARLLKGPRARVEAIVEVAAALSEGRLDLDVGTTSRDLVDRLTAMRGIGPWTAGYVAMRALGDPDILLASDLGLRHGAHHRGLPSNARELAERGQAWSPWRSYAGMHLWRSTGTPVVAATAIRAG